MTYGPFCPVCEWTPYDPEEDTCANPRCEKHWSRFLGSPEAAEGQRRVAIYNLTRRTS